MNLGTKLTQYQLISLVGFNVALNFAWAATGIMATPVFSSLGLTQTLITFATLSGPITGLLQPFIGALSNNWSGPWGRRRPFLAAGLVMTLIGMMIFGNIEQSSGPKTFEEQFFPILFAVLALWMLNLGLNFIQISGMALVMDSCTPSELNIAMSLGAALMGAAGIFANVLGFIDLHTIFPFFSSAQQAFFYCGIVIVFTSMLPTLHFASLNEQALPLSRASNNFPVLSEMVREIKTLDKPTLYLLLLFGCESAAAYVWNLYFTDFMGKDVYGGDPTATGQPAFLKYQDGVQAGSLILGLMNFVNVFSALAIPPVSVLFGPKAIFLTAHSLAALSYFSILFSRGILQTSLISGVCGLFVAVLNSLPYTVLGLLIEENKSGTALGIMNVVSVVFQMISGLIVGLINDSWMDWGFGAVAPGLSFSGVWAALGIPIILLLPFPKKR